MVGRGDIGRNAAEAVEVDVTGTARNLGAGGLMALAALHGAWAAGSTWPLPDKQRLAQVVVGSEELPPAAACAAVAGLLAGAAGLVAGFPRSAPELSRVGAAGVVATLTLRGVAGAVGLTTRRGTSAEFAYWDRRLYSPVCLVLAGLCSAGVARR